MSDTIWITGIEAIANHGVFDFERRNGQRFVVDVGMEIETRDAARSDDLADSVSYADVATRVHEALTRDPGNLIERIAERLAWTVLSFDAVDAVTIRLHKPNAPIDLPFADISMTIHRTRLTVVPRDPQTVVLALGGNMGDTREILRTAVASLSDHLDDVRAGPLVRTAAMTLPGSEPQADYLNTIVVAQTRLSPMEVLQQAWDAEAQAGRVRDIRWGPRTLDVDVVAYGDLHSADPALRLPHPGWKDRSFVVVPWAALEPDMIVDGVSLGERAGIFDAEILESWESWQ